MRLCNMKKSKLVLLVINGLFLAANIIATIVLSIEDINSLGLYSDPIGLLAQIYLYWIITIIPLLCIDIGYLIYKEMKR